MITAFTMGARVQSKGADFVGRLVEGPDKKYGDNFPHYAREGFYYVKFTGIKEIRIVHEDDLVLLVPTVKKGKCMDCGSEDIAVLNYQVCNANTALEVKYTNEGKAFDYEFNRLDGEPDAVLCRCDNCCAEFGVGEILDKL